MALELQKIFDRIRVLSSQRGGSFIDDDELVDLAQIPIDYIYNEIVKVNKDFFTEEFVRADIKEGTKNVIDLSVLDLKPEYIKLLNSVRAPNSRYPLTNISIQKLGDNLQALDTTSPFYYANWWRDFYGGYFYVIYKDHIKVYPEDNISGVDYYEISYVPKAPKIPPKPNEDSEEAWEMDINFVEGVNHYIAYYTSSDISDTEQTQDKWLKKAGYWEKKIMDWVKMRSDSGPTLVRRTRNNRVRL